MAKSISQANFIEKELTKIFKKKDKKIVEEINLEFETRKIFKYLLLIVFVIIFLMGSFSWMSQVFGQKDDNIFEETFEFVVQSKTGVLLDFTPDTQEN